MAFNEVSFEKKTIHNHDNCPNKKYILFFLAEKVSISSFGPSYGL